MTALFFNELKSYFRKPRGYIYCSLLLLGGGLIFAATNIIGESSDLKPVTDGLKYVIIFTTPFLTSLHFTGSHTADRLLFSSPLSTGSIVSAKYLAALAMLLISEILAFIYPIILALTGAAPLAEAVLGYLGLFLFGATLISSGLFISSLTPSTSSAAALTLGLFLLAMLAESVIPLVDSSWLRDMLYKASPSYHLGSFQAGVPGLASIVYFPGLTLFFLLLTAKSTELKRRS